MLLELFEAELLIQERQRPITRIEAERLEVRTELERNRPSLRQRIANTLMVFSLWLDPAVATRGRSDTRRPDRRFGRRTYA